MPSKFIPNESEAFACHCRIASHNAAHRIAVNTSEGDGAYVTRRDTNSWLNTVSGGRIFPGTYSKATFDVSATDEHYQVKIHDKVNFAIMSISAGVAEALPDASVFKSTNEVSDFFKTGNIGWSSKDSGGYDTIELTTDVWNMKPLLVEEFYSSYFSNRSMFPEGSVEFYSAMIMRDLQHSWVSRKDLCDICC